MANKFLYARAGAETYMFSVGDQLQRLGHEVGFFGMDHPEIPDDFQAWKIPSVEFGPRVSSLERARDLGLLAVRSLVGSADNVLREAVRDFKPDIIHAHNIYNQISPSIFESISNEIPVIMTAHDYKPVCPNYSLFTQGKTCTKCIDGDGAYWNCVANRCSHDRLISSTIAAASSYYHDWRKSYSRNYRLFIAPSEFMGHRLRDGGLPEQRIKVINNFAEIPEEITSPGNGLLYAGRLCVEKGIDTLINAYAKLKAPRPPLRIAGEGPLGDELKKLAKKQGLGDDITWLGRIKPEEVVRELENCAVSIIPSLWFENCSMAIMEGLAMGRPCLVSDSGGNSELVRHEIDGWVFKAGDSTSMLEQLQSIQEIDAPALAEMGKNARKAAQKRFSPKVHLERILKCYEVVTKA